MKMNWGKGMALVMIGFMAFIIVLATKMSNIDTNLVEKDYYEKGQNFKVINEMKSNYKANSSFMNLKKESSGIEISFIEQVDSGYIHLYRPSDSKLDIKLDLKDKIDLTIPTEDLIKGKWKAKILFFKSGRGFLTEQSLEL